MCIICTLNITNEYVLYLQRIYNIYSLVIFVGNIYHCGRLSWLPVSFSLHVKYTLSYRIYLRTGNKIISGLTATELVFPLK